VKQSFAWWSFDKGQDLNDFLRFAAELGYDAVEVIDEKDFKVAKNYGLELSLHWGTRNLARGLNKREYHAEARKELENHINLAEQWNIANLVCFSGNRDGKSDAEGAEVTAEILREVAPLAESAGVRLVLELLNSKVDHPDYQCDNVTWGMKVVDLVGSSSVKLLYDIYHMQIMEGDLIRTVQKYHHYFGHYHTAGNPGRNEIDEIQEICYPPIFRTIRGTGYTDYIAHELIPTGDAKVALKQAFDVCKQNIAWA
jgi:hydroxypyruvate isomerase